MIVLYGINVRKKLDRMVDPLLVKFAHAGSNGLTNARGFLLAFDLEQNVADVLIPYTVNDRDMWTVDPRPEFVS